MITVIQTGEMITMINLRNNNYDTKLREDNYDTNTRDGNYDKTWEMITMKQTW